MIYKSKHSLWLLILILPSITVIAQINVQFEPIPADFGINLPNAFYAQNIFYDNLDTKKQRFHLFLPDTSKSYPLVVFIHGGGFTGGTPDEVLNNDLYKAKDIENALGFERGSNFYGGLDSVQQILYNAELIQYRLDVDMLYHMSADDVPMYIISTSMAVQPGGDVLHHALHAQTVFKAAKKANISEVKGFIPLFSTNTTGNESYNDFLIRHLNSCSNTSEIITKTKNSDIKVYPNPAKDFIKVLFPVIKDSELILNIYCLQGTLVLSENLRAKGNSEIKIDVSGLNSGIYMYSISGANTILKGKINITF